MNVQKVVSAVVGLVIVVGGFGCRQLARSATDDVADRVADRAVEQSYDWSGPEVTAPDVDVPVTEEAEVEVPKGWPADLAVIDGLDVLYTTADDLGLNVTGNVDDEVVLVMPDIKADLADAGFTLDDEQLRTEPDGRQVATLLATGPEHTATVTITETPEDVHGSLTIVYLLVPTAG